MAKQILAAFIGSFVAFCIVFGGSFIVVSGYIDAKFVALERIEAIIDQSEEKLDKIFTVLNTGVEGLDKTVTKTKIYEKFFGAE